MIAIVSFTAKASMSRNISDNSIIKVRVDLTLLTTQYDSMLSRSELSVKVTMLNILLGRKLH